jgi:hypothetical protein
MLVGVAVVVAQRYDTRAAIPQGRDLPCMAHGRTLISF